MTSQAVKPAKICIVDDEALVREAVERLIQSLGYDTETFVSAEDFLCRGRMAEASCLVIDVQMPGMTGFELHSRLHAEGYRIPAIFMSGRPHEALIAAALKAGAIGFLGKPISVDRLIDYLDRALKSRC